MIKKTISTFIIFNLLTALLFSEAQIISNTNTPANINSIESNNNSITNTVTNTVEVKDSSVYVIKKYEFQEVNRWYKSYIKRAINKAEKEGATLIILEIDTPGGLLNEALNIKNILIESTIPVVTYINKNALSAGALIALSTKAIYMSEGSVIGAATPVYMQGTDIKKASEKEVSAMRAAMRSSAEISKKNTKVAEAMVDETIVLTKEADGIDLDEKTLLTLSTDEAISLGIADGKASSIAQIIKLRGLSDSTKITVMEENKYDTISKFMLNPLLLTLLLVLGIVGAYIEIKTPGFGIGGTISIISFALFFFAQVNVGGSSLIAPAIFILGSILLLVEIFVIPGFGVVGIAGIILMVSSLFIAFGVSNIVQATYSVFFAIIISVALMIFIAKKLPQSKLFSKISLQADTGSYKSGIKHNELLNKEGIAITFLRPSGTISIDNKKYDAVSDGELIEKGSNIKVIDVSDNKITVSKV